MMSDAGTETQPNVSEIKNQLSLINYTVNMLSELVF